MLVKSQQVVKWIVAGALVVQSSGALAKIGDQSSYDRWNSENAAANKSSSSSSSTPAKTTTHTTVGGDPNSTLAPAPAAVTITPETLRSLVLRRNVTIERELQTVQDAKDNLAFQRNNLLPSIGVSAIIPSGGNFMVSSIQFLLPFLLPSNWFMTDEEKNLFNAEKISYLILELNTYSSALAIYYTLIADQKYQAIYQKEATDWEKIFNSLRTQVDFHAGSVEDMLNAQAQMQLAQANVKKMQEFWEHTELPMLQNITGLPDSTKITVSDVEMPASVWEPKDVEAVVTQALAVAPEYRQIDDLIKAADDNVGVKAFSFLNSATMTSQGTATTAAPFSNFTAGGSVGIGFGYPISLSLASRGVDEVKEQEKLLILSEQQIIKTAHGSIADALEQVGDTTNAEKNLTSVFNVEASKFDLQMTSLINVYQAHTALTVASIARVGAEMDLNAQRVTLHRALLTDQFSQIKGCGIDQENTGFFGGIFQSQTNLITLCIEGGTRTTPLQ